MIPSVGRIVQFKFTEEDAYAINRLRDDALSARSDSAHLGMVVRVGNPVQLGYVYPMMIVAVWAENPQESTAVNGQVFLDGDDTYWVEQVCKEVGQWSDPRVT